MVDLLVDAIDQDVLPPEADTVVRALSRSVSEHVALDDVVVRAAAGVNVERALAVRNFAKHDNSPISGHRQRTKRQLSARMVLPSIPSTVRAETLDVQLAHSM